jgi:hypothetical protein
VHSDEQQLHGRQALSDLQGGVDPIQKRHRDVEDNQVRFQAESRIHESAPIRNCPDAFQMGFEKSPKSFESQRMVVGQ